MAAPFSGLLTADDLSFEPDDGLRRELHDGVVHTHPPTSDEHSWAALAAYRALTRDEPADVYVLHNLGVHVGPRRVYAPDLLVVRRTTRFHDYGYDPGGVLLVVEVVSPSSITLDRVTKPAVYAEQGIPYLWRIDEGPRLQTYRLDPGTDSYVLHSDLGPGETGPAAAPWTVAADMAEFVMPHKR